MADEIEFPTLTGKPCVALLVCAHVVNGSTETRKHISKLQKRDFLAFRYGSGDASTYCVLFAGGDHKESADHLHINLYSKDYRPRELKTNSSLSEIRSAVKPFWGEQLQISLRARFVVPMTDLPASGLIRSARVEVGVGSVKIQQVGARIHLQGAPIREMTWNFAPPRKDGTALVYAETTAAFQVDLQNDYLLKMKQHAESAFSTFALGSHGHEPSQG